MEVLMSVSNQTPIEIALGVDENGMTTARKLYAFLELGQGQFSRWAKANIESNEYYEEGRDWWGFDIVSNGNKCRDYRLTTDFAKHLSMESHSSKGKIARQYFVTIEDKAKQHMIDRNQLSPQLQLMNMLVESMSRQELEQKRQAEKLEELESNQKAINTAVLGQREESFKGWVNRCLSAIAESSNYQYIGGRDERHKAVRAESYERLNRKKPCRLNQRVETEKGRAVIAGANSKQINAINKLTVIEGDKALKPLYEMVIREMMIAYCVDVS